MNAAPHTCGATLAGFGPFPETLAIGTGLAPTSAQWVSTATQDMDLRVQGPFAADALQDGELMTSLERSIRAWPHRQGAVLLTAGTPFGVNLNARLAARLAVTRLLMAARNEDRDHPADPKQQAGSASDTAAPETPSPPSPTAASSGTPIITIDAFQGSTVPPEVLLAAEEQAVALRGRPHPPEAFTLGPLPCAVGIVVPSGLAAPTRHPAPESLAPLRAGAAARRQTLLARAILLGDTAQLRANLPDPNFFPAAAKRIPGAFPALGAAMEAGAFGGFLPGGGPALALLAPPSAIDQACTAAATTFEVHSMACTVWTEQPQDGTRGSA